MRMANWALRAIHPVGFLSMLSFRLTHLSLFENAE